MAATEQVFWECFLMRRDRDQERLWQAGGRPGQPQIFHRAWAVAEELEGASDARRRCASLASKLSATPHSRLSRSW
jgi:hypothetical protein